MTSETPKQRNTGWMWPVAIVGVFGVSLSVGALTVYLATSDPTFAVEDDYYARAVAWDDTAAARERSRALGWEARARFEGDDAAARTLVVTLLDDKGEAVPDVRIEAEVFHHARRSEARRVVFAETGPGSHRAAMSQARDGVWQVRLRARAADGAVFLETIDLATDGGSVR